MTNQTAFAPNLELLSPKDYLYIYTRRQAIEDGVLVDVSNTEEYKELGFRYPICLTSNVYNECVALTEKAKEMLNDVAGRLWDILYMYRVAAKTCPSSTMIYVVYVVRKRRKADAVRLKVVVCPGDNGEPVVTIMYPNED